MFMYLSFDSVKLLSTVITKDFGVHLADKIMTVDGALIIKHCLR